MKQKKIRVNDWSLINRSKNIKISRNLEGIDKVLVGVIPKMFYHYETDKDSNIFIVVPVKYKDKVKEIIGKIVILGAPITSLEYDKIADIIKRKEKE